VGRGIVGTAEEGKNFIAVRARMGGGNWKGKKEGGSCGLGDELTTIVNERGGHRIK